MGRKIALIIGNSEYEDRGLARLITPAADVGDLAPLLQSPDIGGFDEVLTLANEPSTTVRKAIARLFAQKSPDDLVVLYFSGHGVLDDQGQLYLAVKDTERELLSGTAIPATFITGEMDRSRSKRQVLILDCCHSGAFARGAKGAVGASVGIGSAFEGTGYGRVVLTATDATQYAWEGDQVIGQAENSVFTHYLIQGLRTGDADVDADGRVTLDELYDYVYAQVVKATPKQTPGKWSYKQQGDLVIARNPRPPEVKQAELPPELRQAIESPLANVREGAVRELDRLLRSSNPGLVLAAQDALQRLAEDDSRRVSTAASESLNTYAAQLQAEAQERAARQKAEEDDIARAKAEQERLARLAASQLAAQQAEQERLAKQKAGVVSAVAVEQASTAKAAAETEARPSVAAPKFMVWLPVPVVTGGWIAGWLVGIFLASLIDSNVATILSLIAGWGLAGLVAGLILRRLVPSIRFTQVIILVVSWALIPLVGLILQGSGEGDRYATDVSLIVAVAITWLINAWFVLRTPLSSMWWQALAVGVAGAAGWVLGEPDHWNLVALKIFHPSYGWSLPTFFGSEGVTAFGLLSSVILSGLIGGGVLSVIYWLTHRSARIPMRIP